MDDERARLELETPHLHTGAVATRRGDEGWREAVARLPDGRCCWCGGATPLRSVPAFAPSRGPLPLHAICASDMREAYLDWKAGRTLTAEQLARTKYLAEYGSER